MTSRKTSIAVVRCCKCGSFTNPDYAGRSGFNKRPIQFYCFNCEQAHPQEGKR
ncbi:MAG: hypothetical protein WCH62_04260 [Candidatus Omnitrophota bacterium]